MGRGAVFYSPFCSKTSLIAWVAPLGTRCIWGLKLVLVRACGTVMEDKRRSKDIFLPFVIDYVVVVVLNDWALGILI